MELLYAKFAGVVMPLLVLFANNTSNTFKRNMPLASLFLMDAVMVDLQKIMNTFEEVQSNPTQKSIVPSQLNVA